MNWFKQAQLVAPAKHTPKEYIDIGHEGYYNPDEEDVAYLWRWPTGGPLQSEQANHRDHSIFGIGDSYTGRYDPKKHMISIAIPAWAYFKEIPPTLIRDLQSEYGSSESV